MDKRDGQLVALIKSKTEASLDELLDKIDGLPGDELVATSFAACYKAIEQALGLTPFDEQLCAALGLIENSVVQMSTGEGKTISAVFAVFYRFLEKKKAHVLTFNDYLAKRDYNWMKPVYDLLGVKCAYITEKTPLSERRSAYLSDVVYVSAKECCFDFLRDFTAQSPDDLTSPELCCAIVDEADSILVDEARIPLVVAGNIAVTPDDELPGISEFVGSLPEDAYEISVESESVYLTDKGAGLIEKHYEIENIYDDENCELLMKINCCLKAFFLLEEDSDYIVKDNSIMLIDKFTGRVARNRHYPGTLHSAVELKHGVEVSERGTVMATMPLQFFARSYEFLSGMTGTAESAEEEFYELYDLKLKVVPPHRPSQRIDREIEVYYDEKSKWNAVCDAVCEAYEKSQPVLIGTGNITQSEMLRDMLSERGITDVSVLTAKNDEMEAQIIKEAGAPKKITISANMAGRGVDIKPGGADESEKDKVIEAGGLLVISTFMPESSRITLQLSGRSGRQGDVGESRRFVSIDEPIMTRYKLRSLVPSRHYPEKTTERLTDKILIREIERIQRISEGDALDERKRLLKFNTISEKHRDYFFRTRKKFLMGECPDIWEENAPDLHKQAVGKWGKDYVDEIGRKTLVAKINESWCEYLDFTDGIKEGIHLSAIAGKSPAEEYNIRTEAYYCDMEDSITQSMVESLENLLIVGKENYRISVPDKIHTYLLEDNSDELNNKPFLNILMSDETEEYLKSWEDEAKASEPEEEKTTEKKKGFFRSLFGK